MRDGLVALAVLGLVASTASAQEKAAKPKRPSLTVRALPRMAFAPVTVFVTAELQGGDDVEEYYCPELEWDWGDGGKSVQEGDCPPFEPGVSKITRRFQADHVYRRAGLFSISVRLSRSRRSIAKADVQVTIRPGLREQEHQ